MDKIHTKRHITKAGMVLYALFNIAKNWFKY